MPMPRSEWIWKNGAFVAWDDATVHVCSHVLHYGSSVFEGLRAYATPRGPAVLGLDAHLERLRFSGRLLRMELPYAHEELRAAVLETVRRNRHESCYIRPIAYRGYDTLGVYPLSCPVEIAIATWVWGVYLGPEAKSRGVDVGVSSWRRAAPDTLASMAKIGGQYVSSQMAVIEARERGFHEALLLDVNGYLSEGPGENLFLVWKGELYTPPLGNSILGGITRSFVLELAAEQGLRVREENLPREMLYLVDEAFFTGTAVEITPIRSFDGLVVGKGERGPITTGLLRAFEDAVSGRGADRGWLSYVRAPA
ncbi:MAG: branched-chain amino acid transaminase [Planctomycetes bacterium]|nr:branched-chain amino acid transaminase [Planctomycetota bacterium]